MRAWMRRYDNGRQHSYQRGGRAAAIPRTRVSRRTDSPSMVERADRGLSLHHRIGGGGLHYGLAGAGVQGEGAGTDLPTGAVDGPGLHALRHLALAVSPRPSGTVL